MPDASDIVATYDIVEPPATAAIGRRVAAEPAATE